jgi:hypothetical protein
MTALGDIEGPDGDRRLRSRHAENAEKSSAKALKRWQVPTSTLTELRWLEGQGVSRTSILCPWPIGAANVAFHGKTFELDATGERVLTFLIEDGSETIDIGAWQPRTGKCGTWNGVGFAIGQEAIFNPASYFAAGALRVHETPLQWLQAERDGVVVVQPRLAYAYLRNVPRLTFADPRYARQVMRWLQPPKSTVEILVEVPRRKDSSQARVQADDIGENPEFIDQRKVGAS